MNRETIFLPCQDGQLAAWLYRPADTTGAAPCVVMAHGLTGVRDMRLDRPAERFAAAGYVVVVFDYRHFGDSTGEPRQVISLARQYEDWDAAIAFARGRSGVATSRIVLWGTSFSGGHVIDAAARTPVAAAIIQAPFTDGLATALSFKKSSFPRLIVDGLRDQVRAFRGGAHYIPVACEPGGYAMLPMAHVWDSIPQVVPPGSTWRNQVAARIVLRLGMHRPIKRAKAVQCPMLVQVLDDETVLPVAAAVKAGRLAPRGEVRQYGGLDHFDVYGGAGFERLNADQLEFLGRHVPVEGPSAVL